MNLSSSDSHDSLLSLLSRMFFHLTGGSKEMHDDPFQPRLSNLFNLLWPK